MSTVAAAAPVAMAVPAVLAAPGFGGAPGLVASPGAVAAPVSRAVPSLAAAQDKPPAGKPHLEAPRIVEGSPYPTFSRAVVFGGVAYVAGVVGQKPGTRDMVSADFEPQARQTLDNLKASIEAGGSTLDRVLKCTVFLTDAADFPAFNRVYVEYFPKNPPARSTVVVKELVVPGAKLELDCFAATA
ncbi:MAG: RidA family protein [Phycisphaerales bacterium]|nr:RidA family protein [Phycisphaerales bacterium]